MFRERSIVRTIVINLGWLASSVVAILVASYCLQEIDRENMQQESLKSRISEILKKDQSNIEIQAALNMTEDLEQYLIDLKNQFIGLQVCLSGAGISENQPILRCNKDINFDFVNLGTLRAGIYLEKLSIWQSGWNAISNKYFIYTSILALLFIFFTAKQIDKHVIHPIKEVSSILDEFVNGLRVTKKSESKLKEWKNINNQINSLVSYLGNLELDIKDQENTKIRKQVAHDIRSPLSALKTLVLNDYDLNNIENKRLIRQSIDRIEGISNDISENKFTSKMPTKEKDREMVILDDVIKEIMNERQAQMIEGSIQIDFYKTDEYPTRVFADRHKISRVVANILQNSIEAIGRKGQITITLSSDDRNVLMEFRDNGPGIAKEHISQIFQEGKTFGKPGGSGLGLYYCRKVLEDIGGSVDASSTQNIGTVISIRMPKDISDSVRQQNLKRQPAQIFTGV